RPAPPDRRGARCRLPRVDAEQLTRCVPRAHYVRTRDASRELGRGVVAALQAVLAERAEEAVLVEAVAHGVTGLEAGGGVDDAVPPPLPEIVHVTLDALHDERPLVHTVTPVLLQAVAGADCEIDVRQRRHFDVETAAGRLRERQHR